MYYEKSRNNHVFETNRHYDIGMEILIVAGWER